MRTETMPLETVVPTVGLRERCMRGPSISAMVDSPRPKVWRVLLRITPPLLCFLKSGRMSRRNMAFISMGTPGMT
jgi:hypothetical protein